jgi:hypothetical protein
VTYITSRYNPIGSARILTYLIIRRL